MSENQPGDTSEAILRDLKVIFSSYINPHQSNALIERVRARFAALEAEVEELREVAEMTVEEIGR